VAQMPKANPAYFGSYERFGIVRKSLDGIENLFSIGRNGMHKYNHMDHSMLTAVDNIGAGIGTKKNIGAVNRKEEYLETKKYRAERDKKITQRRRGRSEKFARKGPHSSVSRAGHRRKSIPRNGYTTI
jgi:hypothetical protein